MLDFGVKIQIHNFWNVSNEKSMFFFLDRTWDGRPNYGSIRGEAVVVGTLSWDMSQERFYEYKLP